MEKELFDWDEWDGDHECMVYYNVKLKKDIGKLHKGDTFCSALITFEDGVLEFYTKLKVVARFKLQLTVSCVLQIV